MFVIKSANGYLRRRPYQGYTYSHYVSHNWTPNIAKARIFSNKSNASNCLHRGSTQYNGSAWGFPVYAQEVKIQEV